MRKILPNPLKNIIHIGLTPCLATLSILIVAGIAEAQQVMPLSPTTAGQITGALTVNGTRAGAENSRVHILPIPSAFSTLPGVVRNRNNFYGFNPADIKLSPVLPAPVPGLQQPAGTPGRLAPNASALAAFPAARAWNPIDMITYGGWNGNLYGSTHMVQENIYLDCPAHNDSCWGSGVAGNITNVQKALTTSKFITIVDQYVKSTALYRYTLGTQFYADWQGSLVPALWNSSVPVLLDSTAQALAASASLNDGHYGYGYIFHIFVPNGTDVCFDNSQTVCYSPDNYPTYYFCGYHGSFDYSGRHIIYSVEPYDYVNGCNEYPQTANDAQVSVLTHELFEAITDPDPNYQWNSADQNYGEIGDMCAWNIFNVALSYTIHPNIQLEYSNRSHACNAQP